MNHVSTLLRRLLVAAVLVGSAAAVADDAAPIRLQGLDPARSLQRRNRTPELSGELKALPIETLVRVLRDDDAVAFAADDAYGDMKPTERAAWRLKERRAVKHGALAVLARSDDPRAEAAIIAAVDDGDEKVAARAAEQLGARPGREAMLSAIARDATRSLDVRAGACAGLGARHSDEGVDALLTVMADADAELQRSALLALERAASRWAFEAMGDVAAGDALRARVVAGLRRVAVEGEVAVLRDVTVKRLSR